MAGKYSEDLLTSVCWWLEQQTKGRWWLNLIFVLPGMSSLGPPVVERVVTAACMIPCLLVIMFMACCGAWLWIPASLLFLAGAGLSVWYDATGSPRPTSDSIVGLLLLSGVIVWAMGFFVHLFPRLRRLDAERAAAAVK